MAAEPSTPRSRARVADANAASSAAAFLGGGGRTNEASLAAQLQPLIAAVQNPATELPLRVLIGGAPGAGRTTALRAIAAGLRGGEGVARGGDEARVVWLATPQFRSAAAARRALLAEALLATLDLNAISPDQIRRLSRELGPYLGRSFVHALVTLKLESGGAVGLKEKAELASVEALHDEGAAAPVLEPQLPSPIADRFARRLRTSLGERGRLVILADDFDRARRDVQRAIRGAIESEFLGVPLAFIAAAAGDAADSEGFDLTLALAPDPTVLRAQFSQRLAAFAAAGGALHDEDRARLVDLSLALCSENPRDLQRFWNQALISAVAPAASGPETRRRLLAYFLRRWLAHAHQFGSLPDHDFGRRFLTAWANVLAEQPGAQVDFDIVARAQRGGRTGPAARRVILEPRGVDWTPVLAKLWQPVVREIERSLRAAELVRVLRDGVVADLMRRGAWPVDPEAAPAAQARTGAGTLLAEARRRTLGYSATAEVPPGQCRALDLGGLELADLSGVAEERQLERLSARATLVTDLIPLARLRKLTWLDLGETPVTDLAPLADLDELTHLFLDDTRVTALNPLRRLKRLLELHLQRAPVTDLTPLAALPQLEYLDLSGTPFSDTAALAPLAALRRLHLRGAAVEDTIPLAALKSLEYLDLSGTQVEFVAPIARLTHLRSLSLNGAYVGDVSRLTTLGQLTRLDIGDTRVTELAPLGELSQLELLVLNQLPIREVSVLSNLIDLSLLSLIGTEVEDVAPLAKLRHLTSLDLRDTPAKNLAPLAACLALRNLYLRAGQVDDPQLESLRSRLPRLRLHLETPSDGPPPATPPPA